MAKPREIKRRLRSLGKTKQITKTMELVATSKMKRTQDRVMAARPYSAKLAEILASIDIEGLRDKFPLLAPRDKIARVAVVVLTSNRGLAGALNANVIRLAKAQIAGAEERGASVDLHVFGKKGITAFRYARYAMASTSAEVSDKPDFRVAERLGDAMVKAYLAGEIDEMRIVYPRFRSLVAYPPTVDVVIPLTDMIERVLSSAGGARAEFLLEPSPEEILGALLPLFVRNGINRAFLELAASEQAARRVAMKNATDNAEELVKILTRQYNRARQAQITQEIAEIVGGADALK
jgi:F-type H+-transporting ATPase subunit gamma